MEDQKKENRKIDWKFIIGMAIMILALGAMGAGFWKTVAKQAQLVKEEEAREEENAIQAIYVEWGEYLKRGYFVDMDQETIFTADIPKEGIYNRKGTLIPGDVLENGDMVKIYGNGIMTRSLPADYPGVTKMKRLDRTSLETAQKYIDLLDHVLTRAEEQPETLSQ